MYQALYRKWRSKTFDEVIGQEHITTTLRHAVAKGRPPHAVLFCGSRGTGKTSCARILAKAVNCLNPQDGNPCNECEICVGIDRDSLMDVTEIDAASNSGVDNIRDLREEANFTPVAAAYRVYIIDETHMLSTGAFNALLKIMEEPPEHVLFILATTEIHKVPATVLSRCQRFDFHRIHSSKIKDHLLQIAGAESIMLDEDAAHLIARLSDGGMRDAVSLLDLCAGGGEPVTPARVRESAGLTDQSYLFRLAQALADGDGGEALSILEQLGENSMDYQQLCEQLIGFYRNTMVVKTVKDPIELIRCLPDELEQYRTFAGQLSMERVLHAMAALQNTLTRMTRTAQRRAELELGLIRISTPALDPSPEAMLTRLEALERSMRSGRVAAASPVSDAEQKASANVESDFAPNISGSAAGTAPTAKGEVKPFEQWQEVLEALADKNRALYGALVGSKAYAGDGLLLVDAGELFLNMMRGDSYARDTLRDAAEAVTGQKYRLGPWREAQYAVKEETPTIKLDEFLVRASELGADLQVKE